MSMRFGLCVFLIALLFLSVTIPAQFRMGAQLRPAPYAGMFLLDDSDLVRHSFTLEFWLCASDSGTIVSHDLPAKDVPDWRLTYNRIAQRFDLILAPHNGGGPRIFSTTGGSGEPYLWNHVALVMNTSAGRAELYINAVPELQCRFTPRVFDCCTALAFGGAAYHGTTTSCTFAEIRWWKGERTPEEIDGYRYRRIPAEARGGLAGYWMFEDSFADSSGRGHALLHGQAGALVPLPAMPPDLRAADFRTTRVTCYGSTALCSGHSVRLDAGVGGRAYRWSTGDSTRSIEASAGGIHTVQITDVNGRSGVLLPEPVVSFPLPRTPSLRLDWDTLSCDSGYAYAWSHNGDPIRGAGDRFILPSTSGRYRIDVTDSHGCTASAACMIEGVCSVAIRPESGEGIAAGSIVPVTILLLSSRDLRRSAARRFTVTVEYDPRKLRPLREVADSLASGEDLGSWSVRGELRGGMSAGVMKEIRFEAIGSDTGYTFIRATDFAWEESGIATRLERNEHPIFVRLPLSTSSGDPSVCHFRISPNPFTDRTAIDLELNESEECSMDLYDPLGRCARIIHRGMVGAGRRFISCSPDGLPAGVYSLLLVTPRGISARNVLCLGTAGMPGTAGASYSAR